MSNGTYCVQLCRWWWQQKRRVFFWEHFTYILAHDPLENAATSSYKTFKCVCDFLGTAALNYSVNFQRNVNCVLLKAIFPFVWAPDSIKRYGQLHDFSGLRYDGALGVSMLIFTVKHSFLVCSVLRSVCLSKCSNYVKIMLNTSLRGAAAWQVWKMEGHEIVSVAWKLCWV